MCNGPPQVLGREGETLTSMWDEDEKRLLVSLPKTCYKVGTTDEQCGGSVPVSF